jgi:hypothetical protein
MQPVIKRFWQAIYANTPESAKVDAYEFYGNLLQFHLFSKNGDTFIIEKHPFFQMLTGAVLAETGELFTNEVLLENSKKVLEGLIEEVQSEIQ